jgi:hypothetical protein
MGSSCFFPNGCNDPKPNDICLISCRLDKLVNDPTEGNAWHADHIVPVYRGGGIILFYLEINVWGSALPGRVICLLDVFHTSLCLNLQLLPKIVHLEFVEFFYQSMHGYTMVSVIMSMDSNTSLSS